MDDTYISFYLRVNRIHVFVDALRGIGYPSRICFMLGRDGQSLLMVPYQKKDFRSHCVPKEVYNGVGSMEVCSLKLCRIVARLHNWDVNRSYRVPGLIYPDSQIVVFQFSQAEIIETGYGFRGNTLH